MHPLLNLLFIILINLAVFKLVDIDFITIIVVLISIYIIFTFLGIIGRPQLFQNHFRPCICYIKDAIDPSSNKKKLFNQITKFIDENNLNDFSLIIFYYDKFRNIEKSNQRFSIGLYKKINGEYKMTKEKNDLLVKEGFRRYDFEDSKALYTDWDYYYNFTKYIGIWKFYNLLYRKIKSQHFLNAFNINENQMEVVIEIYHYFFGNKRFEIFIPFENKDKFMIYQKNK